MKKFLLKLLMGASLTTSVFIFQACYGPAIPDVDIPRDQTQLQEAIPENPEVLEDEEIEAESEEEATPESL
jgi:hypothetical protein